MDRYADDAALIAEWPLELQDRVTALNKISKPYGMEMNTIKIKTMVVSRKNKPVPNMNISIAGMPTQQTNSVIYLGHMVTGDGKREGEIYKKNLNFQSCL